MIHILKNFQPSDESYTKHSAKLEIHDIQIKSNIFKAFRTYSKTTSWKRCSLRIENDRLFQKKQTYGRIYSTVEYKISCGKLYKSDTVVDEFTLSDILKEISTISTENHDILFILENSVPSASLPKIQNYTVFSHNLKNHGGIAFMLNTS